MKQYEAYKDSGIQWLGEIPSHWMIMKLAYTAIGEGTSFIDGDWIESPYIKETGIRYVTTGNVTPLQFKNVGNSHITEDDFKKLNCTEVFPGDILISRLNEPLGRSCIVPDIGERLVTSVDCVIYRPDARRFDSKFMVYYLNHAQYTDYLSTIGRGTTMKRIARSMLAKTPVLIPPLAEQEVIAAYLDQKVGKIDAILSEKEAMVEQLQQYRKSLISETVTRGLDPDVPMKDSGIDWIGQIPQHWSMVKLKYISSLQSGSNLTSEQIKDTGEYPVFGGNGLRGYYHDFNTEGDRVLIGRQGALCGNINYASGKFWATEHAVVCHPIKQYNVIWLGSLLEIMNLNQYSIASAQPGLSVDRIKQLEIPLPPFEEQEKIGSLIEKKDSELKQTISELQSQIEDLKAYKSSVITEAVTGKVDLRDWKPSEVTA